MASEIAAHAGKTSQTGPPGIALQWQAGFRRNCRAKEWGFAQQKGPWHTRPGPRGFILPPWPGYPLLGCSPALPNSVLPGNFHDTQKQSGTHGPNPKPAKRAHRVQGGTERPTIGKIRSITLLPLRGPSEITKRIPSIHRLVLTRPFVAGINAPRDSLVHKYIYNNRRPNSKSALGEPGMGRGRGKKSCVPFTPPSPFLPHLVRGDQYPRPPTTGRQIRRDHCRVVKTPRWPGNS